MAATLADLRRAFAGYDGLGRDAVFDRVAPCGEGDAAPLAWMHDDRPVTLRDAAQFALDTEAMALVPCGSDSACGCREALAAIREQVENLKAAYARNTGDTAPLAEPDYPTDLPSSAGCNTDAFSCVVGDCAVCLASDARSQED